MCPFMTLPESRWKAFSLDSSSARFKVNLQDPSLSFPAPVDSYVFCSVETLDVRNRLAHEWSTFPCLIIFLETPNGYVKLEAGSLSSAALAKCEVSVFD